MSLCIVSAFLDIGRNEWSAFSRSINQYFMNFMPYTKILHPMILYMDDRYSDYLKDLCKNASHIKIIPINRKFLVDNIYAYSKLEREKEIMESKEFKSLTQHRQHHPECSKPEYNIMQHAKIDFVIYTIKNNILPSDYYAWSDFGYFQDIRKIPQKPLDLNNFDLTKVNFQGINPITDQDFNINYTLLNAPERIGGFFYLGSSNQLLKYQTLYHETCTKFHKLNIVDDDQHIMIRCLYKQPDLFKVHQLGGWHLIYLNFQQK